MEVRENHPIRLQCLAKNAKPAARIIWYRGRTELKSSKNFFFPLRSDAFVRVIRYQKWKLFEIAS